MNRTKTKLAVTGLLMIIGGEVLDAQSVVNTVHNFSASGPGTVSATTESAIFIFCHTLHE